MKDLGKMAKLLLGAGLVLLLVFVPLGPAGLVHAASFTVNSTADAVDATPGDGACSDAAGNCTLRAAIMEANALAGPDTITLPAGTYTLSIPGRSEDAAAKGDLDITDDLSISGDGKSLTIVDGNQLDRVFDIHGGSVTISGVTVQNGNPSTGNGGGIRTLTGSTLTLTASTVSGNSSLNSAGGIWNQGTLILTDSVVSLNSGNSGGGIRNDGTLTVTDSTISANTWRGGGGGIWHFRGTAQITNSTISNHIGSPFPLGGGILTSFGAGPLTLTNSTVSGNTAWGGAGIWNGSAAPLILSNSTVTDNTATASGGGGIRSVGFDSIRLRNTVIAANAAPSSPDCGLFANWNSQGFNLIGDTSGCNFNAAVGDQVGTGARPIDPQLGPLQDNGGPTETHELLQGSSAIDAGNLSGCTDDQGNLLTTDQRGEPRPVDGDGDTIALCDIGAFELGVTEITLAIDIKPGSFPNSINRNSRGTIPVAILSTADFDAPNDVMIPLLRFGRTGDEPSLSRCGRGGEDVNGDGLADLVCHFFTNRTGFQAEDTEGTLRGETIGGTPIEGRDSVRIVGR